MGTLSLTKLSFCSHLRFIELSRANFYTWYDRFAANYGSDMITRNSYRKLKFLSISNFVRNIVSKVGPRFQFVSPHPFPPSTAYMRQWTRSAVVQIMAYRLSAPSHYLNQHWLIVNWTLRNTLQPNLIKIQNFSFIKMHLKMSSAKWLLFCTEEMS